MTHPTTHPEQNAQPRPFRAPVKRLPAQRLAAGRLTVTAHMEFPGVVVVVVRGEVDSSTSPLLRDRLLAHLRSTGHRLVVDLSEVSFLAAAGLTVLLATRESASAAGIELCVVACTRPVERPLVITGLDDVFDVHADVADALRCPHRRPG